MVAYGVHETGRREVLGTDVGAIESEAFWREFVRSLVARGLQGVRLCISDAHTGLKRAIAQVLGCPWQRCTVRFVRDIEGHVGRAQQQIVSAAILVEAEDDLLAFMHFPAEHWSKLRSTNPLERINREIGRRSDVVGIYPNDQSLLRLTGALLLEQTDEWLVSRRYLSLESLAKLYHDDTIDADEITLSIRRGRREVAPAA